MPEALGLIHTGSNARRQEMGPVLCAREVASCAVCIVLLLQQDLRVLICIACCFASSVDEALRRKM